MSFGSFRAVGACRSSPQRSLGAHGTHGGRDGDRSSLLVVDEFRLEICLESDMIRLYIDL